MIMSDKAVVFLAGKEEYALPIEYVHSIEKPGGITLIPHMPAYVLGLSDIRGELIPLIDLENVLFQSEASGNPAEMKWILVKIDGLTAGLAVRDAKEIVEIPQESIKQIGLAAYEKTSFISGVASLPESRLIAIINPDQLMNSLEGIRELKAYMDEMK
ncbi:purine-binding chemotaxis protein CheW [Peribacillus deserti]|uniref:Purine-binding chemotaxis protein CheW n=1 Tax=Peribacillus deserti TaxID=673318 RepID=A0ABS2QJ87_9BACI|nr:chemotaxis protein CheW [Peribacillus deserti]MBM7693217.1 purine-binding chemotaxis protein CheW [Peribacillus deserti]